jgi:hypothetical protein
MAFIDTLIACGFTQGEDDRFDKDCYIKWSFKDGVIHVYHRLDAGKGEWNYAKMTEDCDVISEITFNPDF